MSSPIAQSEQSGQLSPESKPQVVVRAGKYFLCSACGTMVQVPAEVVGQLVIAVGHPSQDTHVEKTHVPEESGEQVCHREEPTPHVPASDVPIAVEDRPDATRHQKVRPPRPKRPKEPQPVSFAGTTIDGLRVPTSHQLDRALAWVTFHLKVLDRQGSEVARLKKLLKRKQRQEQDAPASSHWSDNPSGSSKKSSVRSRAKVLKQNNQEHTPTDISITPRPKSNRSLTRRTSSTHRQGRPRRSAKRLPGRGPPR